MWVEFVTVFRWRPKPGISIRYLPGMRLLVTRRCASAAIAKGAAKNSTKPGADDGEKLDNPQSGAAGA